MNKLIFLSYYFASYHCVSKYIFFSPCQNNIFATHDVRSNQSDRMINVYQPSFYLNDIVRINTNFMTGTTQKVLYLNYPFTFSNNQPQNAMKNTNTAGIIILRDQPSGMTTANFATQTSIQPIAYFTLQQIPIGWELFSPSDYYNTAKIPTQLSFYSNNIYIGKIVGPQERIHNISKHNQDYTDHGNFVTNYYNNLMNFYVLNIPEYKSCSQKEVTECDNHDNISERINIDTHAETRKVPFSLKDVIKSGGSGNIVLGSNSGTFQESRFISFNTIIGMKSGNELTGSCNTFIGSFNGSRNEISTVILNQDYYSSNSQSNYNNGVGFANFNLTISDTTYATGRLIGLKQNNVFGNFNFYSMNNAFRNIVLGNRNLSTTVDNITQFNWIDTNIVIGNNILYKTNTQPVAGMYGNIIIIPNADELAYGGLGLNSALSGVESNYWTICNNAIFLGSCGLPIPYERSNKTFIGNIYNSCLFYDTIVVEGELKRRNVRGKSSFPIVNMSNNADQVGHMELVPYGDYRPDKIFGTSCPPENSPIKSSYYKCQPGNIFNIDNAVNYLLNPESTPIIGIAFDNTPNAAQNGLFYTIDIYSMLANQGPSQQNNPLYSFIIYNILKQFPPYANPNNLDGEAYAIYNYPEAIGYEHYYLIPLIIKAIQNMNATINNQLLATKNIHSSENTEIESMKDTIQKQKEIIDFLLETYTNLQSILKTQNEKIESLEKLMYTK
jgi:hypothetical protein